MAHALPPLPYDYTALEPHIDEQTMRIHHDKHHAAYVNNLNAALESHAGLQGLSIEALIGKLSDVPESARGAVRNNGGGHYNHTLFWELMAPGGAKAPAGKLAEAIDAAFGSGDAFKEQFAKAGMGRFGSGWAWLVKGADGKVSIESSPNQDSPVMDGKFPVLGCDVWEHAYYLKYQNRRADYLAAWWNVLNWTVADSRYDSGK
jgi:Fe-Mn family superoxide dismutase